MMLIGDSKVSALYVMQFCILDIEHPRWCVKSKTYGYYLFSLTQQAVLYTF
jgi:hypothetical protein